MFRVQGSAFRKGRRASSTSNPPGADKCPMVKCCVGKERRQKAEGTRHKARGRDERPTSNIQRRTSNGRTRAKAIRLRRTSVQYPTLNVQCPSVRERKRHKGRHRAECSEFGVQCSGREEGRAQYPIRQGRTSVQSPTRTCSSFRAFCVFRGHFILNTER